MPFLNYLLIMIRGLKFLLKKKFGALLKKMGHKLKKKKKLGLINPGALGERFTRLVV
jgi:hypothetical protein